MGKSRIIRTGRHGIMGKNMKNWKVIEKSFELDRHGYPTGKFVLKSKFQDNNKYSPFYHGVQK